MYKKNNMKGFISYNIDYVIKFGGSLLEEKDIISELLNNVSKARKKGFRIVIIPGGGPTDNTIERLDSWATFHKSTHHFACALAQDQTGSMLADIGYDFGFRSCDNLEDMMTILNENNIPIILPSKIIFTINPFERTWDITSDSMSAWFSWLLNCKKVIILTNVNGVYSPGNIGNLEHFISEIKSIELSALGHTSVDQCFGEFISVHKMEAWIINGLNPGYIHSFFNNDIFENTHIYSE